jgi:pyruvate dehydrogenase E1 component
MRRSRVPAPAPAGTTPYLNTIPSQREPEYPVDYDLERRVRSIMRWNAIATVLQANKESSELGGHIASYQSAATLYEVGFNHFWHAPSEEHGGDLIYMQGHSSPGVYARAFLEGRLSEEDLLGFRQEVSKGGLSSYPHPWLMPDFWQFPTVSMGLGPIMAIYQARFMKYLTGRGLADTSRPQGVGLPRRRRDRRAESLGAISLAGRESLDNLIFVVNCNLQRLDGPVRGNGKIIQELETVFRGAGWNVLKVIWGSRWDALLAADHEGLLCAHGGGVDGDYQTYKSRDGAYVREHFFGTSPELREMVETCPTTRSGRSTAAASTRARSTRPTRRRRDHRPPTVILAKTIKGYGMGEAGEGQNITHQQKKMTRTRCWRSATASSCRSPTSRSHIAQFYKPPDDSPEMEFLRERARALGGSLPARRRKAGAAADAGALGVPVTARRDRRAARSPTTMSFVRILSTILRDKQLGKHVVPIVPDESRTFGMEGMFRQLGIFSQLGQLYTPEDREQLMFYREDKHGPGAQEGINEAGAMSSWIAAGTSYSNHGVPTIPFYIYYSMFGFQRVGDLAWAAGRQPHARVPARRTAGARRSTARASSTRTALARAVRTIPNCVSYDPTFGYEVAVIVQEGLRRMLADQEDVYYYLTLMNENYPHPPMPEGAEEGILRGMHLIAEGEGDQRVQLLGSGTILREVMAGAELLRDDWGVGGRRLERHQLHRAAARRDGGRALEPPTPGLRDAAIVRGGVTGGPRRAGDRRDRLHARVRRPIRPWVAAPYRVLGTDGSGARTGGARCATSSRSTAGTSRRPR